MHFYVFIIQIVKLKKKVQTTKQRTKGKKNTKKEIAIVCV